jgi:hypothetical protein
MLAPRPAGPTLFLFDLLMVGRMPRSRVHFCLAFSTQQMNSLRARGVMSFHASRAVRLAISVFRRSPDRAPPHFTNVPLLKLFSNEHERTRMYRRRAPTSPPRGVAHQRNPPQSPNHNAVYEGFQCRVHEFWRSAFDSPLHRDEPAASRSRRLAGRNYHQRRKNLSTCAWPRTPAENLRTRRRHEAPGPPTAGTTIACHLDPIGKR